jgi:hypothetical protein
MIVLLIAVWQSGGNRREKSGQIGRPLVGPPNSPHDAAATQTIQMSALA